jgi:hypothetical protein
MDRRPGCRLLAAVIAVGKSPWPWPVCGALILLLMLLLLILLLPGLFERPAAVAFDVDDNLYVLDDGHRMQVF